MIVNECMKAELSVPSATDVSKFLCISVLKSSSGTANCYVFKGMTNATHFNSLAHINMTKDKSTVHVGHVILLKLILIHSVPVGHTFFQ